MNTVSVLGRLTRDPETTQTAGGKPVVRMRVAVPRSDDSDGAEFVDVVAYDGLATVCGLYLARGRRVAVSGRLVQEEWESTSGRRERVVIVARDVEFVDAPPTPTDATVVAAA